MDDSTRTSRTGTTAWRKIAAQVRNIGRQNNLPCVLCGGALGPVDYRTTAQADRDARNTGQWWLIGQPRPLALAVDHIVPHAAGGADSLDNTQVTHAVCNQRAGAKGARRARANTTAPARAVIGHWIPLDSNDDSTPLLGRAVPGQRTRTHIFRAD